MTEDRCRWNGSDQPRTVPGRHDGECVDEACRGCAPCPSSHCRVCGITHSAGTCAECLAEVRDNLREIGRLCNSLPTEVEHRGVEGEAMMLLAPAANPEARGHLEASVLAGRLDKYDRHGNLVRSGIDTIEVSHVKDCEDPHCVGCAGELHPEFVLGGWDSVWREALDHDEPAELFALVTTIDYLDRTMSYMGTWPHVPFEDFAKDLRRCRAHLEAVLHDGEQIDRGAPCMACRSELRHVWKGDLLPWSKAEHPEKAREDGWACARCRRWHNEQQYHLAVASLHTAEAKWLTDRDMEQRTGVKAGTVRVWANRGEIAKRQDSGRVVYAVAEVMARAGLAS